jgi:hypothetical protein
VKTTVLSSPVSLVCTGQSQCHCRCLCRIHRKHICHSTMDPARAHKRLCDTSLRPSMRISWPESCADCSAQKKTLQAVGAFPAIALVPTPQHGSHSSGVKPPSTFPSVSRISVSVFARPSHRP